MGDKRADRSSHKEEENDRCGEEEWRAATASSVAGHKGSSLMLDYAPSSGRRERASVTSSNR